MPTFTLDEILRAAFTGFCKTLAAPLAVLEWKCDRPGKEKQKPDSDRDWLTAFTVENPASLGYPVLVDFAEGGVLRRLTVARCSRGEWDEGWFERIGHKA